MAVKSAPWLGMVNRAIPGRDPFSFGSSQEDSKINKTKSQRTHPLGNQSFPCNWQCYLLNKCWVPNKTLARISATFWNAKKRPTPTSSVPRSMLIPAELLSAIFCDPGTLGSWVGFLCQHPLSSSILIHHPLPTTSYHPPLHSSSPKLPSRNSGYWPGQTLLMYPLSISSDIILPWPYPSWLCLHENWFYLHHLHKLHVWVFCLLPFTETYISKNILIISAYVAW